MSFCFVLHVTVAKRLVAARFVTKVIKTHQGDKSSPRSPRCHQRKSDKSCRHSTFFFLDLDTSTCDDGDAADGGGGAAAAAADDDNDDDDNDDDDVLNRSAEWEKITKSDRKKIGLVKSDDGEFW